MEMPTGEDFQTGQFEKRPWANTYLEYLAELPYKQQTSLLGTHYGTVVTNTDKDILLEQRKALLTLCYKCNATKSVRKTLRKAADHMVSDHSGSVKIIYLQSKDIIGKLKNVSVTIDKDAVNTFAGPLFPVGRKENKS